MAANRGFKKNTKMAGLFLTVSNIILGPKILPKITPKCLRLVETSVLGETWFQTHLEEGEMG